MKVEMCFRLRTDFFFLLPLWKTKHSLLQASSLPALTFIFGCYIHKPSHHTPSSVSMWNCIEQRPNFFFKYIFRAKGWWNMEHEGRNQHLNLLQQILATLMLVSTWFCRCWLLLFYLTTFFVCEYLPASTIHLCLLTLLLVFATIRESSFPSHFCSDHYLLASS